MKKMITPEAIEEVLNSFPYTSEYLSNYRANEKDRFSLEDYEKVIKTLLDYFYPGYCYDTPWDRRSYKDSRIGGTVIANKHMLNTWHYNCKVLTFNSLYPNTIIDLYNKGILRFNIKEFGELFKTLCQSRIILKQKYDSNTRNNLFLKVLINFTYGALRYNGDSRHKLIACNNPDLIPSRPNSTFSILAKSEPDNIIYVDTDKIYLYEMTDLVKHQLDNLLKMPYEIEDVYRLLVISKKRYFTMDEKGNVTNRGIRDFK